MKQFLGTTHGGACLFYAWSQHISQTQTTARLRMPCGCKQLQETEDHLLGGKHSCLTGPEATFPSPGPKDVSKRRFLFGTSKILGICGSCTLVPTIPSESRLCHRLKH